MIALAAASIGIAATPLTSHPSAICDVGRVALRDLPSLNHNPRFDAYYAGSDARHQDLLDACPELKAELPANYPLADDDARARASVHVPRPGPPTREAFIYSIGIPEIAPDGKSAIVRMGYDCTGLCGAGFEARYVRTAGGWRREGAIRMLFVS